ncbi:MAG: hypothetical protein U9O84_04645 [Chloroflexota bacterium]|nr:hypothetical protein [Chloroflexota bacterium]
MPEKGKERTQLQLQLLIQYQEQVLIPVYWIKQADELIQASKKLKPSINKYWLTVSKYFDPKKGTYNPPPEFKPKRLLQSTYFMLVAYAIENYFKAIMIAESEATYRSEILRTGKLPQALNNHNLITLTRKTKFTLTDIETNLLTRLSRNSVWQGRYPVPVNANQLNSMAVHNGRATFTAFLAPGDINNLDNLIRRIRKFSTNKALSAEERRYLIAYT